MNTSEFYILLPSNHKCSLCSIFHQPIYTIIKQGPIFVSVGNYYCKNCIERIEKSFIATNIKDEDVVTWIGYNWMDGAVDFFKLRCDIYFKYSGVLNVQNT